MTATGLVTIFKMISSDVSCRTIKMIQMARILWNVYELLTTCCRISFENSL